MTIRFYTNTAEKNRVNKSDYLTQKSEMIGTLRESTSIINPVITIHSVNGATPLSGINYMYIVDLDRYYFIVDISTVNNDIWVINAKIDVLHTYKRQIYEQKAIIKRQENLWNLYLNDGSFKVYQNPHIKQTSFPYGFTGSSFVLAVAGG